VVYPNYHPDFLLETVYNQMGSEDRFLFDCHLFSAERENEELEKIQVKQAYQSKQNVHFNIGSLLDREMDPNNCVFHLDLISEQRSYGTVYRTNKWLQILKDITLSIGPHQVYLAAGDTIQLGFTYKYSYSHVRTYLQKYNFQELKIFLSDDGHNLIALVRKI